MTAPGRWTWRHWVFVVWVVSMVLWGLGAAAGWWRNPPATVSPLGIGSPEPR